MIRVVYGYQYQVLYDIYSRGDRPPYWTMSKFDFLQKLKKSCRNCVEVWSWQCRLEKRYGHAGWSTTSHLTNKSTPASQTRSYRTVLRYTVKFDSYICVEKRQHSRAFFLTLFQAKGMLYEWPWWTENLRSNIGT